MHTDKETYKLPNMGKHGGKSKYAAPLIALLGIAVIAGITAAASTATTPEPRAPLTIREAIRTPTPIPPPVKFAAVGDSLTAWVSRLDMPLENRWAQYAQEEGGVELVGGWAKGGATIEEMLANTWSYAAEADAQVLVIMAGTNNLSAPGVSTTHAQRLAMIDQIVAKSEVTRVVLAGVAPYEFHPEYAPAWNASLEAHAASRGWLYVDPWQDVRTPEQTFKPEYAGTTLHPNDAGSEQVGIRLRQAILEVAP